MGELGQRSRSQVLRGYLPQQTQDLNGGIYRVSEWSNPAPVQVDDEALRRHLLHQIRPFEQHGTDAGVAADLRAGARIEVVEVDDDRGVQAERFPQVWLCHACRRIGKRRDTACRCGARRWGQLHFVGFHKCGRIEEPWIKRCPQHDDVQLISPRSAKAADIRFVCPTCHVETMKGLGFKKCPGCGQGQIIWNVHKARSVYAPVGSVIVNAPRPEQRRALLAAGGARRALDWVLHDMNAHTPAEHGGKPSRTEFTQNLVTNGIGADLAEHLADQAAAAGGLDDGSGAALLDSLPPRVLEDAEYDAVDIAIALADSRVRQTQLPAQFKPDGYDARYQQALTGAGLHAVDLIEQFPVLNFMYGFTRGGGDPFESRLVPFRAPRRGYRLHGELSPTEALYFQLDPLRVAHWLGRRGFPDLASITDPVLARLAILATASLPQPGDTIGDPTVGSEITTLVHTMAHRVIRQASAFAGIDRDALSEYLIPRHLGFFVYAAARGDFVLGGLQAMYESDMDALLRIVSHGENRCPLDPGCSRGTGACSACLHIGEPSCRGFNTLLDRRTLFGQTGYWA